MNLEKQIEKENFRLFFVLFPPDEIRKAERKYPEKMKRLREKYSLNLKERKVLR